MQSLFAATILAARKLNDPKRWPRAVAITDAIDKAKQILEQIEERCLITIPTETFPAQRPASRTHVRPV